MLSQQKKGGSSVTDSDHGYHGLGISWDFMFRFNQIKCKPFPKERMARVGQCDNLASLARERISRNITGARWTSSRSALKRWNCLAAGGHINGEDRTSMNIQHLIDFVLCTSYLI